MGFQEVRLMLLYLCQRVWLDNFNLEKQSNNTNVHNVMRRAAQKVDESHNRTKSIHLHDRFIFIRQSCWLITQNVNVFCLPESTPLVLYCTEWLNGYCCVHEVECLCVLYQYAVFLGYTPAVSVYQANVWRKGSRADHLSFMWNAVHLIL